MVFHRRSHRRHLTIEAVNTRVGRLVDALPAAGIPPPINTSMDGSLDPAAGELDAFRAEKKRQQIASAAAYACTVIQPGDRVVEFGAGQGHLGLLIAHARPDCHVTLVEVKEYSCDGARARVAGLGLSNCDVFCGTVDAFAESGARIDCLVGLHLCGLLTDSVLDLAVARHSAVCLVPCCYGQIVGSTNHERGGVTAPNIHPRSRAFREALGIGQASAASAVAEEALDHLSGGDANGEEAFHTVARGADIAVVGKGGAFDPASTASIAAMRCMRIVDTDRCLYALERWGSSSGSEEETEGTKAAVGRPHLSLGRLDPPSCTPKASLILIRPLAEGEELPATAVQPECGVCEEIS